MDRLTLTNDTEAQTLLREGLENSRKQLVPPAKAIQFLARDDHGTAAPLFRKLALSGKKDIREQALRALATDKQSVPLFESIASDKAETTKLRQIAAVNLKNTSTTDFSKLARELVLDGENDDHLRAAAVSAITHTSDVASKVADPQFSAALETVRATTTSRALKASINRYSKAFNSSKT